MKKKKKKKEVKTGKLYIKDLDLALQIFKILAKIDNTGKLSMKKVDY